MTPPQFSGASASDIPDELLSAFVDGEVSASERQRVEQALFADTGVQQRLRGLEMAVDLYKEMPAISTPRAFVLSEEMVLAARGRVKGVERPSPFARFFSNLLPVAAVAVAVALVIVVGVDVWSGVPTTMPASAPESAMLEIAAAAIAATPMASVPEDGAIRVQFTLEPNRVERAKEVAVTVEVEQPAAEEMAVAAEAEPIARDEAAVESSPLRVPAAEVEFESIRSVTAQPQAAQAESAESTAMDDRAMAMEAPVAEMAAEDMAEESMPVEEMPEMEEAAPEPAAGEALPEVADAVAEAPAEAQSAAEAQAAEVQPVEAAAPPPAPLPQTSDSLSTLRVIEYGLLALFVVLLLLVLWRRRTI